MISVDFGTTNTVAAEWIEGLSEPKTMFLDELSLNEKGMPPLIPSLIYFGKNRTLAGNEVVAGGLSASKSARFFYGFKREIVAEHKSADREIDGRILGANQAAEAFLTRVFDALKLDQDEADLVLTFPVESFEPYKKWFLEQIARHLSHVKVNTMDESTAAAIGYGRTAPNENIMVIDFGGGTLDVSVVRAPKIDKTVDFNSRENALVIAKSGAYLGGEDIDLYLLTDVLKENGLDETYINGALKAEAQRVKIELSAKTAAEFSYFDADNFSTIESKYTRDRLEELLEQNGFFSALHHTLDEISLQMSMRGFSRDSITRVVMVGGTCQIPSVQKLIRQVFGSSRVFSHKPFEAVAHGALLALDGSGIQDYINHSYGIRFLDTVSRRHKYQILFTEGMVYPTEKPVKLLLSSSRHGQTAIELVIAEIQKKSRDSTEITFDDQGRLNTSVQQKSIYLLEKDKAVLLNDQAGGAVLAVLAPPGKRGDGRLSVEFGINARKQLVATVYDNTKKQYLYKTVPIVNLS
jgi:molecular chaperone DnaK (HSP70)